MKLLGRTKFNFISPDLNVVTATCVNFSLFFPCFPPARLQSDAAAPALRLTGITGEIQPFLKYGTDYEKQQERLISSIYAWEVKNISEQESARYLW